MKIIDEKGRLFGLINLLDLAVLIGAAAILYVGVSTWLALRQPPLEITGYSPSSLVSGSDQNLIVNLKNERYLNSVRLFLKPSSGDGGTLTYQGKILGTVRDSVLFTIPGDIPAGRYEASFEAITMNVFKRRQITTSIISNKFIVEDAPEQKKKGPVFENQCRWKLSFASFLISGNGEKPSLTKGMILHDLYGIPYKITSISDSVDKDILQTIPQDLREQASTMVGLEVTADYDSLPPSFFSGGSVLTLKSGSQIVTLVPEKKINVLLDVLFYIDKPEHTGLLASGTELREVDGGGRAVVTHSFGDVDNPWITKATVTPRDDLPRAFDVSRVTLECSLKKDGLYFGNTRMEPNKLMGFQANGVSISGGILSIRPLDLKMVAMVFVEAFPMQIEKLLVPGVQVFDNRQKQIIGRLIRVRDSDRPDPPGVVLSTSEKGFGRDFKRMILELELDCGLSGGAPLCAGQPVNFGRPLNFNLLGQPLTGEIRYDSKLPPRSTISRETVQVEFRNVPPEFVAWLRVGEQEYSLNGPSTWKIVRVISTLPAKLPEPVADPHQGLVIEHPLNKDIRCMVELETRKVGNDFYYAENILKIGATIRFNAKKWAYPATLVAF